MVSLSTALSTALHDTVSQTGSQFRRLFFDWPGPKPADGGPESDYHDELSTLPVRHGYCEQPSHQQKILGKVSDSSDAEADGGASSLTARLQTGPGSAVGPAIDVAMHKIAYARTILKGEYAGREAGFLDHRVLDRLRQARDVGIADQFQAGSFWHGLTTWWRWWYSSDVYTAVHEARMDLEASAARVRSLFGGSKAAAILSCAAHDLRPFDPLPMVHPVLQTVGR
ncbi:unnamed protein product [Amoebophrya sp. A25]|nr:unnamed protein product [Amoebophrya sp. A25]|eukprot:GSA25T00014914001.1